MKATYALTIAATKMLFRNATSLIFTFMLPMLILLGVGFMPQSGAPKIGIGVVAGHATPASERILAGLRRSKAIALQQGDLPQLRAALAGNKLALIVELPDALASGTGQIHLYSNAGQEGAAEIAKALLLRQVDQVLTGVNGVRAMGLDDQRIETKQLRYVSFLLPGLIGLAIMQMCVFSVAPVFVFYRERGILKRLLSTPMKPYQFILSNSLARLLLACTQAVVFLAVGAWVFDSGPTGSYFALALCILLGTVMFLGLGFSVAGLAESVEMAPVLANLATFPMMFLGGTFFSLNSMPHWLQEFAGNLPLAHFSAALRAIINDGADLNMVLGHVEALTIWSLAFLLLALATFRVRFAHPA